jgi:site-specific DNA-methyltransferase (adenine-specific)
LEYSGYDKKFEAGKITLYQADCMKMLPQVPDKYYDLCICDPPYGIGVESWDFTKPNRPELSKRIRAGYQKYEAKGWDEETPTDSYFKELFRVSANQIIWGENYFKLPVSRGWAYWNKGADYEASNNFSHGELAWTSFDMRLLSFKASPKSETNGGKTRIHPTQKPVALYRWLLDKYAKPGQRILDTHLGSGSIAIACHDLGFDLEGYEIDTDYYNAACDRLKHYQAQGRLFEHETF